MPVNAINKIKNITDDIIHNKQLLIKILSIAVILALALIFKISNSNDIAAADEEIVIDSSEEITAEAVYYVDISGAVVSPGVYKVKPGTRLYEVVEQAGGLRSDADTYSVNQAAFVEDGAKIIIPTASEVSGEISQSAVSSLVNINTADKALLCTLPGIGDVIADRIIEYRSSGRFTKKEDLLSVKGIGNSIYEDIESSITV